MNAARATVAESTRMFQEAASASDAVRAQLQRDADAIAAIGAEVRRLGPRAVITCARGSADHAAPYPKFFSGPRGGVVPACAPPAVSWLYGGAQDLPGWRTDGGRGGCGQNARASLDQVL